MRRVFFLTCGAALVLGAAYALDFYGANEAFVRWWWYFIGLIGYHVTLYIETKMGLA